MNKNIFNDRLLHLLIVFILLVGGCGKSNIIPHLFKTVSFQGEHSFSITKDGRTVAYAQQEKNNLIMLSYENDGTIKWTINIPDQILDVVALSPNGKYVVLKGILPQKQGHKEKISVYDSNGQLKWTKDLYGDLVLSDEKYGFIVSQRTESIITYYTYLFSYEGKLISQIAKGYGDGSYISRSGNYIVIDNKIYDRKFNEIPLNMKYIGRTFISDISNNDKYVFLSSDNVTSLVSTISLRMLSGDVVYEKKLNDLLEVKSVYLNNAKLCSDRSVIGIADVMDGKAYLYKLNNKGVLEWKVLIKGNDPWKDPVLYYDFPNQNENPILGIIGDGINIYDKQGKKICNIDGAYGINFTVSEDMKWIYVNKDSQLNIFKLR